MSVALRSPVTPVRERVPPLHNGDRLDAVEFRRRYESMPAGTRAELIEGIVYLMPSPVRHTEHGRPNSRICWWLTSYAVHTPGVDDGTNSTTRLDLGNEPQPDALLRLDRGQSRIDEEGYIVGAPELVAEIAGSSVAIDLHRKLDAYLRNGVREYLVWRVDDDAIDWFVRREDRFEPLPRDPAGVTRSETFPGLWLSVPAMLALDGSAVLRVLNEGLAQAAHAAFVETIRA
jgi:Uma2 family endonuclease